MSADRSVRHHHVKRALMRRVSQDGPLPPLPSDPNHGHAYRPKPSAWVTWVHDVTSETLDAVEAADESVKRG